MQKNRYWYISALSFLLGLIVTWTIVVIVKPYRVSVGYVDLNKIIRVSSEILVSNNRVSESDFLALEKNMKKILLSKYKDIVLIEKNKVINKREIFDYTDSILELLKNDTLRKK